MSNSEKNPWKITKSKTAYDNPWIKITHNEVINPSGNEGIYGVVHFKNYAVGVLPLDQDLNTYLVGQYRFPLNAYSWEIPEGGCPESTNILATAKRELKEEVGLIANIWTPLLTMHLSNSVSDEIAHLFIAQDLVEGIAEPEETEELVVKKLPFAEVYQMVMDGAITDSMSVAAILKAKILMEQGDIL
ncbi:MAG: NUDIX domain-containing protein [Saprospiraceae bacterium]